METERKAEDAQMLMPKPEVFEAKHIIDHSLMNAGKRFHIFERVEYPPEGGIYIYYQGLPYPKKGWPYPEAVQHIDMIKQITLTFVRMVATKDMLLSVGVIVLLPWKIKARIIKNFLENFTRTTEWIMRGDYLKDLYYSKPARTVKKVVRIFLGELNIGLSEDTIAEISRAVASIVEYDDAYRYRLQDLMTEANQFGLIDRPASEIKRLAQIFRQREKTHALKNISSMAKLASLAVRHPKIRKAFIKAIRSLTPNEFDEMRLDNADRYHVLLRNDYDFLGFTADQRVELYKDVHRLSECCKAKVSKRDDKLPPDWICSKCKMFCAVGFIFPQEVEIAP